MGTTWMVERCWWRWQRSLLGPQAVLTAGVAAHAAPLATLGKVVAGPLLVSVLATLVLPCVAFSPYSLAGGTSSLASAMEVVATIVAATNR